MTANNILGERLKQSRLDMDMIDFLLTQQKAPSVKGEGS